MTRPIKQLVNTSGASKIDDLSAAAYYQDTYLLMVVTPRGVWSVTQVAAEKFKEEGMLPASREVWRTTWQAVRALEQQHEWVSEHPQGTEFDVESSPPPLPIQMPGQIGTCVVCGGPAFTQLADEQGQIRSYCFRDLPQK